MKKRICFVAQFPPPIHGLSKAVETLFNSEISQKYDLEKIDITNNKKIIQNLVAIHQSKADLFYFTISQTKGGNLRDLLIFKAISNRPCLVHLHGGYYRTLVDKEMPSWQRKINYKIIGRLSGAIVLGPSLRWIFSGMLPDEKILTVQNCVDNEYLMSEDEFQKKISTSNERRVRHILYLSNFIRTKGYPEVLNMAKLEKKRGGERLFHFDFAGKFFEKKEEDFFWEFIRNNELEDYITYHGAVAGDKKRDLLKMCDFFCLLTTYPNEGQPISILEAMGNGMVIIATSHAGIPDLVEDGKNGIIKKDINIEKIYDELLRLNSTTITETGKENRKRCLLYFKECDYISNMSRVFSEAIQ